MRLLSVILFLSYHIHLSFGQEKANPWEFFQSLHAATIPEDSTSLHLNVDSLNQAIFKDGKARLGIDTLRIWKLAYEYQYGWIEVVDHHPLRTEYSNIYYATAGSKNYSGAELFKQFHLNSFYLSSDTAIVHSFPDIQERYPFLNMLYTPIISGDYLIIKTVHSNLFGSQTSFYHEYILYFKMDHGLR